MKKACKGVKVMTVNQCVISAIRSVINPEEDFCFNADIDFDEVFRVSLANKVENIVAYALEPYKEQIGIWKKFEECMYVSIVQNERQEIELEQLLERFSKAGIDYMILKGYIIKNLYPSPDMRTMGDIDILIKPENADGTKKIFDDLGYRIIYENIREFNCRKPPMIDMEIHLDMISEQYKEYHEYYKNIWERVNSDNGIYKMTDEDYLIYHIIHLMKHYKGTGTGIRSFLDIHVFLQKKGENLDWEYISEEFKKLNMEQFAKNAVALAKMCFGNGERTDILSEMEEYVFESGVYGSDEHAKLFGEVKARKEGKFKMYRDLFFPDIHVMSSLYPALIKRRYLMPLYWFKRLFEKIVLRKTQYKLKSAFQKNSKADKISEHFRKIGL